MLCGSKEAFGQAMGMSKQRINSRLKGATDFTRMKGF